MSYMRDIRGRRLDDYAVLGVAEAPLLPSRTFRPINPRAVMPTAPTVTQSTSASGLTTPVTHYALRQLIVGTTTGSATVTLSGSSTTRFKSTDVGKTFSVSASGTYLTSGGTVVSVAADGSSAVLSAPAVGANGSVGLWIDAPSTEFRYYGHSLLKMGTGAPKNLCIGAAQPAASWFGDDYEVHFETYGQKLELMLYANPAGSPIRLWVDDGSGFRAHTATVLMTTATTARNWVTFDFGTVAARQIRLEASNDLFLYGVNVDGTGSLGPGAYVAPYRLAVLSDSYVEGGFGTNVGRFRGPHRDFGKFLGFGTIYNRGQGSTGWLNDGTAVRVANDPFEARLAEVATLDPDVLCMWGGVNDTSFTGSQVQSAVASAIATARALMPDTRLFVAGPWVAPALNQTTLDNIDNGVRAACVAAGVEFASPRTGNVLAADGAVVVSGHGPIIQGTNSSTNLNGGAFLHTDNLHATQAGYEHIARWLTGAFNALRQRDLN